MYYKIMGGLDFGWGVVSRGWGANLMIILADIFHLDYIHVEIVIYHSAVKSGNQIYTINTHPDQP